MSIYGEFLLAFPEQYKTITVYDMTPLINGGFSVVPHSEQIILGIYQNTSGRRLQDSNGNLVQTSGFELWTTTPNLTGKFTEINQNIYRLNSDNNWVNEGGFVRYGLEKVVGNNGTEPINTSWNIGTNNFG